MKSELDLFRPDDYEAFADFCRAVARSRKKDDRLIDETFAAIDADRADAATNGEPAPETVPVEEAKPTRQRGQPSPGKQRRTKAEIAEDEAAAAADAPDVVNGEDTMNERVGANISSGAEDRQDPENPDPVDDEATAEADAVDERAETASTKSSDASTHDDIRGILGKYRDVYGMDAAMADGPVVLQEVCGEGVVKISDVPDDKIAAVLDAIKKAGNENRFDRKQVA